MNKGTEQEADVIQRQELKDAKTEAEKTDADENNSRLVGSPRRGSAFRLNAKKDDEMLF